MSFRRYSGLGSGLGTIGSIILLNVAVFIVIFLFPGLIFSLGLQPARVINDPLTVWTIISSMFVHAGIWHILANMFTLYFFGNFLLRFIGTRVFLLIYFLGGIAGGLFFIWLGPPFAVAVGASGAVFAVGGALAVIRPQMKVFVFPIPLPVPLWIAVVGGFIIMSFVSGVAWEAHLGGLIVGGGIALLIRLKKGRFY